MKAEKPAEGILKTNDFGNSKWYHVVCGCGQPDHSLTVEVEAEETGVNVNTYARVKTDYWSETFKKRYDIENNIIQNLDWFWKDVVNGLIRRVSLTWSVWIKGYLDFETTVLMSKQQALNFSKTIESAIADVEEFENNLKKSSEVKHVDDRNV